MRDLLVTLIVIISCYYTFKKPYIGILLWSWLSYMNPHRLSFGFAYSMPFAQITAIVLMISMFLSKEEKKIPWSGITVTWLIFLLFMGVTTFFAFFPEDAFMQYKKVVKIQLVTFLTMMLITDMVKLKHLIWVIVLSIGFFSVKGGVFTLATGGGYRVWGPPGSFIEENNGLAIGVLMAIPLMNFLMKTTEKVWVKSGCMFAIITSLFTVLGSQSRGALIAIVAVGIFYWIKSDKKVISTIILAFFAILLLSFMPESWFERMDTINTYDQDSSAMGRINAWQYAINAANDNFLGMGFDSWSWQTFAIYAPEPSSVHAAHSIYFSVIADHGWIGFFLYFLIYFMTWRTLVRLLKNTADREQFKEHYFLAKMLQVSFIAYFVGGAFLSLSYFDLPWHMVSMVVILNSIYLQQATKSDERRGHYERV